MDGTYVFHQIFDSVSLRDLFKLLQNTKILIKLTLDLEDSILGIQIQGVRKGELSQILAALESPGGLVNMDFWPYPQSFDSIGLK